MPEGAYQPVIARDIVVFVARDPKCCSVGRKLEATLTRPRFHPNQDDTNIPAAATAITTKVNQPGPHSSGGFVRSLFTLGSLVNKTTGRINGGASTIDHCRPEKHPDRFQADIIQGESYYHSDAHNRIKLGRRFLWLTTILKFAEAYVPSCHRKWTGLYAGKLKMVLKRWKKQGTFNPISSSWMSRCLESTA